MIVPLIQIDYIRQSIPEQFVVTLPTLILGSTASEGMLASETLDSITIVGDKGFTISEVFLLLWAVGMCICLLIFVYKLYKIWLLKQSGEKTSIDGIMVYLLPETDTAFSFFNSIFLGEMLSEAQKTNILLHEQVHIKHRHSIDLLFFELQRIIFWFNPLIYVFQNKMILLQEFIADSNAVIKNGKRAYYEGLLSQVFKTESISIVNTFFKQSLIKKRITMLQKSKSRKIVQLKYLLLLPIVGMMLVYTACSNEQKDISSENEFVSDTEVMDKINELAEAIMKKGNLSEDEVKALKFLSMEAKPGDKVYLSVQEYLDDTVNADVPFAVIEKGPTFPGCEDLENEVAKKCMSKKITEFVGANFNTKVPGTESLSGRQRISVKFKIDASGNVVDVQANAEHKELEQEAIRVVSSLPKMLPGEHQGKAVGVLYALPIIFALN
ncbi:M56 family metallopeptidase [Ulvibacter antarcticus]|nr:M56 family metallopeptidase [Ulvibacter antarcticus]